MQDANESSSMVTSILTNVRSLMKLIESIFYSSFMVLPFVDGWCENPIVMRSGGATNTKAA